MNRFHCKSAQVVPGDRAKKWTSRIRRSKVKVRKVRSEISIRGKDINIDPLSLIDKGCRHTMNNRNVAVEWGRCVAHSLTAPRV